jgi:hypothetical protein
MRRKYSISLAACVLLVGCATLGYWFWTQREGDSHPPDEYRIWPVSPRFLPGLDIAVPDGYELTREDGPDFDVYYLKPAGTTGPGKGGLGIYVGWWPNSFRPETGCKEESAPLCGKDVKWYSWDEGGTMHREAFLTFGDERSGVTVHAFIFCDDRTQLALLQRAAGTIRLIDKRKEIPRPATHPATSTSPATQVSD